MAMGQGGSERILQRKLLVPISLLCLREFLVFAYWMDCLDSNHT